MTSLFSTDASDGLVTRLPENQKYLYCAGILLDARALGQELHGTQAVGAQRGVAQPNIKV